MWTVMPSPIGDLRIVERDGSIVAIEFSPFKQSVDGRPLGARSDDEPVLADEELDEPAVPTCTTLATASEVTVRPTSTRAASLPLL